MARIDLNCDLGEGAGHDTELMPWITSANIACGAHAGDEATMRATVALAQRQGVAIGAHPGFADREHFGRRELVLSPGEIHELMLTQIRRLQALTPVRHVKPHGALYNMAARDPVVAQAVAEAVRAADPSLVLVGLAGSGLLAAGRACGLRVASEVFADRGYRADGTLRPRNEPGAVITAPEQAVAQALSLAQRGRVRTDAGNEIELGAETICLHGDGANPVALARRLREALQAAGIDVAAL